MPDLLPRLRQQHRPVLWLTLCALLLALLSPTLVRAASAARLASDPWAACALS